MSKNRIEKLRKKFILVASLSFFLVMLMMGGLMYLANLLATHSEIHMVLNYIVKNDGDLRHADLNQDDSGISVEETQVEQEDGLDASVETLQRIFNVGSWVYKSAEFPYSTRYFAVLFDNQMNVEEIKTSHIAGVEPEAAEEYAQLALNQYFRFGHFGDYYYQVADRDNGGKIVVYLESVREIYAANRLLYTALTLIGVGSIATLFLVRTFSYRMVREEVKSMETQDQFLTNASHELKTPLAVIKANTEVEQMLNGENEWNQSTMRQVERMTELIQNLIRIVRAEEKENVGELREIDVTAIVEETADTFETVASQDGKHLERDIDSSIRSWMWEGDLRQLVSILLDNAIKYCDDGGTVHILTKAKGKNLRVAVSNSYAEGENIDYSRFFERFYRKDESHNVDKGGYGIGLSIAENLVGKYRGSIDASWKSGVITFTCLLHLNKKR